MWIYLVVLLVMLSTGVTIFFSSVKAEKENKRDLEKMDLIINLYKKANEERESLKDEMIKEVFNGQSCRK